MNGLFHGDNMEVMPYLKAERFQFTAIYADCIYESLDFGWIKLAYDLLTPDGVLFVQTDYHSVYQMKLFMDGVFGPKQFINHLIYMQEWGGTSKRSFPKKHDDILFYAKNAKLYKFYPERIQIPKATAGTAFDKKGTGLKTPCDVLYDLGNFSTMDKERVKGKDGKNIRWQKPLKLMHRLLAPTTDQGDWVLDPFAGTNSTGYWCKTNGRNYIGIEWNDEIYEVALERTA